MKQVVDYIKNSGTTDGAALSSAVDN